MKYELPDGWITATVNEIAEINPRHSGNIEDETLVTFVPMAGLNEESPEFSFKEERSLGDVRKGFTHFAEGDVLFAKITPCMENGKGAVAHELINGLGCGTTEVHVLRPLNNISPYYIYRFLSQRSVRRDAKENFTGTAGQLRVPKAFVEELELPVPPLAEQQRIVAKLEPLLVKIDSSRARLARISVFFKRFRQSVLAAACAGRLTADWREEQASIENTESIVERVRQRRQSSAESALKKHYVQDIFSKQEEGDDSALPEGWAFTFLNKLCSSFDYGTSSKSQPQGAVPVLRMGNLQKGQIDWSDLAYTSDRAEIKKYSLVGKTVLFNRTNSPELVGKTSIYRNERPAIFAGYLIRINHLPELNPEYLNYCLNSNAAREFCRQVKTDGVSQSNINAQKVGMFEIPFCSLTEQQEIVRRVEALFALADRIDERYRTAKKQVDNLTQSTLAKAFRGELVSTEAELAERDGRIYESAEQMLERIRLSTADRAASGGQKRVNRRNHAK
jgi:type I restriction enzyme S subunit